MILYPGGPGGKIGVGKKIGNGCQVMTWIGAANQRSSNQPLWAIDKNGKLWFHAFDSGGLGATLPESGFLKTTSLVALI